MCDKATGPGNEAGPRDAIRRHRGGLVRPGDWVTHPDRPDWGVGQVQSVIGTRITVTFEHVGKVLVNAAVVGLEPVVP